MLERTVGGAFIEAFIDVEALLRLFQAGGLLSLRNTLALMHTIDHHVGRVDAKI